MHTSENKENLELDYLTTKNKRDQYLCEIRKTKVDEMIARKRIKIADSLRKPPQNDPNNSNPMSADSSNLELVNNAAVQQYASFPELTEKFFAAMNAQDFGEVFRVIQDIRYKLSANDNPPLDEFMETGLAMHIFKFLEPSYEDRPDIQFESLWILTNCVAGTPQHTNKILTKPLLQRIFQLMYHSRTEMVEIVIIKIII